MIEVKFTDTSQRVVNAADKAAFRNLGHAAASIRKTAAKSIRKAPQDEPSPPGDPPHTHRRVFYRRALRYDVSKQSQDALIGFRHSIIGDVGAVHEFGETRDGVNFPKRPTVGPALEQAAPRLGELWRGTIGA